MSKIYDEVSTGILDYLEQIEDPRKKRGVRYRFSELLLMTIYSVLSGYSEATQIEYYVEEHFAYFQNLIQLKEVPSHDTFSRVLQFVDIEELGNNIGRWISDNFPEICERVAGNKVLHVDGKAVKAACRKSEGQAPVYNLNAMYEGESISLNVQKIDEKTNELSSLPNYLKIFDLKNTIVTIDAAGCYRTTLQTILDKKGHYLVPVKENQRGLLAAIQDEISKLEVTGKFAKLPSAIRVTNDHGRHEEIKMTMIKNTSFIFEKFGTESFFGSIARIGVIDKTTKRKEHGEETVSTQRAIVITDLEKISVDNMLKIKLSHWNVEAQHWLLDVQLNEDRMTARKGNATGSGAVLRRFCMMMRKYCPEFESKPLNRFLMSNSFDIHRIEKLLFIDAVASF